MPEQLEEQAPPEAAPLDQEAPPLDPRAVERAYRLHRARRQARVERRRRTRRAGIRFWVVLVIMLAAVGLLAAGLSRQFEQLFGL